MAFTDRYRKTASRPSGPSGNIVVRSDSIEHNADKTAIMTGTVISGMGEGEKITIPLPEAQAKMLKSGLMKHAKGDGGEFHFTGVEIKGGKASFRHLTLLTNDAEAVNDKNTLEHNVMVRPRVRLDRDDPTQVRSIHYQVMDPKAVTDVPAKMEDIIAGARAIFSSQIEAGREQDGIGWLIHKDGETDFRTFNRRSTAVDGKYVPNDLDTTVRDFVKAFSGADLKGDAEADAATLTEVDKDLEGYAVKIAPVKNYPVVGDTFGREAAEFQKYLQEGQGFTKLGTHVFHQENFSRRLDILMNSRAIPDATKEVFVENFVAQAGEVAKAAFEKNGKFSDVPSQEIGAFIRNVGFKSAMLGDGYGYGWGRACILTGADDGRQPIVKVVAPTVSNGTPLPYMEETKAANNAAFNAPREFIKKAAEWDPSIARDNDAGRADEKPHDGAEIGANDLTAEDLN